MMTLRNCSEGFFIIYILLYRRKEVFHLEKITLDSPVTRLNGIKSVRAAQLQKLGIQTISDLIAFFPRDYEDRTKIAEIETLEAGVPACFEAMVITAPKVSRIRKGLDITQLQVADLTGKLKLVFFNQPYLASSLHYGETYRFFGTLLEQPYRQMQNPVFEPLQSAGAVTGRLVPVYALTSGLSNSVIQKAVSQALELCLSEVPEILPASIREKYGLCSAQFAYQTIHNPESQQALSKARERLVFEEFFVFSFGLQKLRNERTVQKRLPYQTGFLKEWICALPFSLTAAQSRVIEEVMQDLSSGSVMNRLIQGDVGSGKTMIAAAAVFCAVRNAEQAALLAPTEILAKQHYASLSALMSRFHIHTVLLTGSMTAAEKRRVKEEIASGQAQFVIGTHALLTEDVSFSALGLVVADEQHRFGVAQRASLAAKGVHPHLLVMSATPIPRTLALIVYGDLDVSVLDELPPGREPVDTFLVGENMRQRIHAFIRKQCMLGGQTYIVCPAIEEGEMESLKSAELWAQTLQKAVFPDLRVGLLHGKMKGAEKEAVMDAFAKHELDILVSTTVVEVGVDVPNANLMVIENAERFGLSQLHQLRGRVGRGKRKSYCVLFTTSQNEDTLRRLKALVSTNDGFQIAEEDLRLRGPGDFFGSRQHGLPLLRAANLQMDLRTLSQAQEAAQATIHDPASQSDPAYNALHTRIETLFEKAPVALN